MSTAAVDQIAVSIAAPPGQSLACVRLGGALDLTAEPALADAVTRLATLAPRTIVIDLGAVTFACTTLANFVVRVHNASPAATLTLCRATPIAHRVLHLTGIDAIVALRSDLPAACDPTTPNPDESRS